MTDEELIELGNKLYELNLEKQRIGFQQSQIKHKLVEHMEDLGVKQIQRGGMVFQYCTKLYGKKCKPFVQVGRRK